MSSFDASSSQAFCRVSFDGCSFELPIDGRLWKVFEEPTAVETISKDQRAVWISFCEQHRIPNASEVHFDHSHSNLRFWTPYTKSKGSVCLIEEDTTHYYAGMTVESAAYNPTMTPTQVSLPSHCNHSRAPSWLWSLTKPPWTRSPTC